MKTGWSWVGLTLVLTTVSAQDGEGQNHVFSPDSSFSVVLPATFEPLSLNAVAQIQFGDTVGKSYFMAIVESKADLYGWNLTRHSMVTLAQAVGAIDFPELSGPTALEIGGYPAVQYELRGASQGTQIVYLHTTIDTPGAYAQLLAWSVRSQWPKNEARLRDILASFQISGAAPLIPAGVGDIYDIVSGVWAWENRDTGCDSDTQTFSFTDDRTGMTITQSEPFKTPDGEMRSVTEYVIEGVEPTVLHTFIPDETRRTDEGSPVKWDLVTLSRNRMTWHRTDWPEDGRTAALRRCDESGPNSPERRSGTESTASAG
jgi:hypothetical protein